MTWPRRVARTLVLGHRGASAHVTENTMAAFRRAIDDGADGIELDVRLCATGQVLVFHDDDLVRLAERDQRVEDLSWDELSTVELTGGYRIPLLEEVLAEIPGWINVEIKPPPKRRVGEWSRAVADVITASAARDRVLVTSFHPGVVGWLRVRRSMLATGMLFHAGQSPAVRGLHWLMPGLAAVHPHHVLLNAALARRYRRRGLAIGAWTVDDPRRARRLIELGVTAIITNDPGGLRAAVPALGGRADGSL
jgi:glycerophosphoryl diester phosphodiesterase